MFTFKGTNSTDFLRELSVGHSVLPPSQIKSIDIEGVAGSLFISKKDGVRTIEVGVAIIENTQTDFRTKVRDIANWLDSDEPETLIFSDEPDKQYKAIVSGDTDIEQIVSIGTGAITFLCLDPYAYNLTETTRTLNTIEAVERTSSAPVFPTFTATCNTNTSSFRIELDGGEFVEITTPFTIGDVVVINMKTGKVTINGSLSLQTIALQSDFFPLHRGTNSLTRSSEFDVEMTFIERFK